MAAVSKHKYDVNEWLYKIINSCKTVSQFMSAKRLIRLYEKKYPMKVFGDDMYMTNQALLDWWQIKFDSLLKK